MKPIRLWKTLHPVTRIVAAAAAMRLIADTVVAVSKIRNAMGQNVAVPYGAESYAGAPFLLLASIAHAVGYSLLFIGSAATVELLYRIWRELRHLRLAGVRAVPAEPGPEPPTSA